MPTGIYKRTEKHKEILARNSIFKVGNKLNLGKITSNSTKEKLRKLNLGKKLSETHKKKISIAHIGKTGHIAWNKGLEGYMKGKLNPNWKGGITPLHNKIRGSIEYKLWNNAVFARDGYICQKTGKKGGNLVAHHIQNFSAFPELRFAIDNGITLSREAHIEFHKIYGKKNNSREQLEEFLNNK